MARRAQKKTYAANEKILCCPRLFVSEEMAQALEASPSFDQSVELTALPARLEASPVEHVVIGYQSADNFVAMRTAQGAAANAALGEWIVVARRIEKLVSAHPNEIKLLDMALVAAAPSVYAAYLDLSTQALESGADETEASEIDQRLARIFVSETVDGSRLNTALDDLVVKLVNELGPQGADTASLMSRYQELQDAEARGEDAERQLQRLRNRVENVEAVAQSERERAMEMNEAIQNELEACHVQQRTLELRLMSLEEDRNQSEQRAHEYALRAEAAEQQARELLARAEQAELYARELQSWRDGTVQSFSYRVMNPLRRIRSTLK